VGLSREVHGAEAVASGAITFSRLDVEVFPVLVNGAVGAVTMRDGRPIAVAGFTVSGGRVAAMDILADPDRLSRLDLRVLGM
jgi:RNA polymerase sigma-70 factor (ECF subfamily)